MYVRMFMKFKYVKVIPRLCCVGVSYVEFLEGFERNWKNLKVTEGR